MEGLNKLPETLSWLQDSLDPFVKPRKTVLEVRKTLRLYLNSHIQTGNQKLINLPLLLPDNNYVLEGSAHGVKGLQKEYLRCLDLNTKVRNEYIKLSSEHRAKDNDEHYDITTLNTITNDDSISPIDSFADLLRKKNRQSRLTLIQNCIENLEQKPAAAIDYLDLKNVLRHVATIPQVPTEVMQPLNINNDSVDIKIGALISQLERDVFLARKTLEKEHKLLANMKSEQLAATISENSRIHALKVTRNELIKWIEAKLPITDEIPVNFTDSNCPDSQSQSPAPPCVSASLKLLMKLYSKYIEARKNLLASYEDSIEANISDSKQIEESIGSDNKQETTHTTSAIFFYSSELSSLSSQQKVFIEQKLHLATNLTKQLEEANQGFERLAQESHLLTKYPVSQSKLYQRQRDDSISFSDAVSNRDKPNLYRHGKLWTHAAHSAGSATMNEILQGSEMGRLSLSDVQNNLAKLDFLTSKISGSNISNNRHDIWSDLNENTDRIKAEISNSD
ncbi:hypothetical protein HI914_01706 [Erysiphe necator]|nr:hypothetical protein HI914_01706 [Erysiphe necator]